MTPSDEQAAFRLAELANSVEKNAIQRSGAVNSRSEAASKPATTGSCGIRGCAQRAFIRQANLGTDSCPRPTLRPKCDRCLLEFFVPYLSETLEFRCTGGFDWKPTTYEL